jgi:hypothetical protein
VASLLVLQDITQVVVEVVKELNLVEKVVEAKEDLLLQEQQILVEVVVDLIQVH